LAAGPVERVQVAEIRAVGVDFSATMLQKLFTVLLVLQFVMNGFHDWIDIPGLIHGKQVRATIGVTKMMIGTAVNSLIPASAAAVAIYYWQRPAPSGVRIFWLIYCAVVVLGANGMWWIPYFRGTDQKTRDLYSKMYAGTRQVLPPHGDNPRPNVFHLFLHALGATNLILAVALWL
jgi:hypothetical protein